MGAPKKKWSEEEEGALNAGIERYGAGKWSAILNDPDYQSVLSSRTNVDLKDKWRNIRAMKEGVGHRQRGFGALRIKGPPKSQNKNLPATSGAIVQYVAKTAKAPKLKHSVPSTSGLALAVKPPEDLKKDVQMQVDPQSSDMEIVQVDSPKAGKHGTTTAGVKYEVDDELQQQKMLEEAVEVVKHGRTKAAVKLEIDYKELVNMTEEEANIAAAEAVAEAEAAIERAARAMRRLKQPRRRR